IGRLALVVHNHRKKLGGYGPLNLSEEDLKRARELSGNEDPGVPFARKIVLVIEPEVKEKL
ncbi:MAG: hypothetical protein ACO3A2_10780, partial [Bdellovibrionia bacterium]